MLLVFIIDLVIVATLHINLLNYDLIVKTKTLILLLG